MIHWNFSKIATSVLAVLGIGTLTSCYGMAPNYAGIQGNVTTTKDSDGNGENDPVQGISVRVIDSDGREIDKSTTNESGNYYLSTSAQDSEVTVVFEDADGAFKTQSKKINLADMSNELNAELEDSDGE